MSTRFPDQRYDVYVPDPPAGFAEMVVEPYTRTGFGDALGETAKVPEDSTVKLKESVAVLPSESVTVTITVYGEEASSPLAGVQLKDATFPGVPQPDGRPDQAYEV